MPTRASRGRAEITELWISGFDDARVGSVMDCSGERG
jgi:hypothetical protein